MASLSLQINFDQLGTSAAHTPRIRQDSTMYLPSAWSRFVRFAHERFAQLPRTSSAGSGVLQVGLKVM